MTDSSTVKYNKGFKYQLMEDFIIHLPESLWPSEPIKLKFIRLSKKGKLQILKGYAWDGASGPAIDRKSTKRGSLVHDALYQLLRAELLIESCREAADMRYGNLCAEDGMWNWLSRIHIKVLKSFGGAAADPSHRRKILTAP